jgi:hypothetical protein
MSYRLVDVMDVWVVGWFGSPAEICVTTHGFTCDWN